MTRGEGGSTQVGFGCLPGFEKNAYLLCAHENAPTPPPHAFDPWQLGRLATRPHPFVSCWAQSPECRELRAGIAGAVSGPHLLQTFELLQGDLVTHVQGCAGRVLDEAQARHVFSQASLIYCVALY